MGFQNKWLRKFQMSMLDLPIKNIEPQDLSALTKRSRGVQGQKGIKALYETTNFHLSDAFYGTQFSCRKVMNV